MSELAQWLTGIVCAGGVVCLLVLVYALCVVAGRADDLMERVLEEMRRNE